MKAAPCFLAVLAATAHLAACAPVRAPFADGGRPLPIPPPDADFSRRPPRAESAIISPFGGAPGANSVEQDLRHHEASSDNGRFSGRSAANAAFSLSRWVGLTLRARLERSSAIALPLSSAAGLRTSERRARIQHSQKRTNSTALGVSTRARQRDTAHGTAAPPAHLECRRPDRGTPNVNGARRTGRRWSWRTSAAIRRRISEARREGGTACTYGTGTAPFGMVPMGAHAARMAAAVTKAKANEMGVFMVAGVKGVWLQLCWSALCPRAVLGRTHHQCPGGFRVGGEGRRSSRAGGEEMHVHNMSVIVAARGTATSESSLSGPMSGSVESAVDAQTP
ncbi:hypothetical protein PHLGIDRAFT_16459 [Phlebiopsis gigantea 11061_1 CR5-6]|uniref:Uncharacterized protein n=1 Tax=Phlebiopsis gigantea (strain 11061_1 CR5-6) TaxID=745531 RepID=A0A0C3S0L4_PHLG1|nr:hypothetical protein PHLGIDRAFT_16459 [Phlebiopsis gigantea 11061_1 CR5-6]